MAYRIGAVGLGHWFFRLSAELKRNGNLELYNAAATSDYETKKGLLDGVGLDRGHYYRMAPGSKMPREFLEGIDVVYISTPNEFHAALTREALEAGKYVITEKTYGNTREEFYDVVNFIKSGNYESKAYLHLHYLHKPLVMELPNIIKKITREHGKIKKFATVFWEEDNEIDKRRAAWLLKPENGGVFMDWIHPFEILVDGLMATGTAVTDAQLNELNSGYSTVYPTGVDANVSVSGDYFVQGATGTVRVGKGVPAGYGRKTLQVRLESGALLYLSFVSYENELDNFQTGYWELYKDDDLEKDPIDYGKPESGQQDLFAKSIEGLCRGDGPPLTLEKAEKLFGPQWQYQEIAKKKKLVKFTREMMDLKWILV